MPEGRTERHQHLQRDANTGASLANRAMRQDVTKACLCCDTAAYAPMTTS